MSDYTTVIFDLDGTLVDTKEGILNACAYALSRMGIPHNRAHMTESCIGPPLHHIFHDHFSVPQDLLDEAIEHHRRYYKTRGIFEIAPYTGITDMLLDLEGAKKHLYVATMKPTLFAKQVLANCSLLNHFEGVVGGQLGATSISKSSMISHILRSNSGTRTEESVMVGDRSEDIIAAKSNGITSIGVMYGYGRIDELESAHPTLIVNSVEALSIALL